MLIITGRPSTFLIFIENSLALCLSESKQIKASLCIGKFLIPEANPPDHHDQMLQYEV